MFKIGDEVSYGIHGKCVITAIETKVLGDITKSFYQMKALRNPIAPKVPLKSAPAILVPVDSAEHNGLRTLIKKEETELALKMIVSDANYFDFYNESWTVQQKKLEDSMRREGFLGLVKVYSYLHDLLKGDPARRSDIIKFFESVQRNLFRELADALDTTVREIEQQVSRTLKQKSKERH